MKFGQLSIFNTMLIFTGLLSLVGCSRFEKPTAPAKGKVSFEGKPVTGGTLQFSPVTKGRRDQPGKPGLASIHTDGTFEFSTYGDKDGLVVCKGKLSFTPPQGKVVKAPELLPDGNYTPGILEPSPYEKLKVKTSDVEIQAGDNVLDVVLVK